MSFFDRSAVRACPALVALFLLLSCTSPGPPAAETRVVVREDPYLLEPGASYPLTAGSELALRVDEAYGVLRLGGDLAAVEVAGREVLAQDPGFHPGSVLLAQVSYLRREDEAAIDRLRPVVGELPNYEAAQMLLGRAAERSGDVTAAFESFSRIEAVNNLASEHADKLRPRAIEIVSNRLRSEASRGRLEDAEIALAWLEEWAEDSREALEGAQLVAVGRDDPEAELQAVRPLAEQTGELGFRQRDAELEG